MMSTGVLLIVVILVAAVGFILGAIVMMLSGGKDRYARNEAAKASRQPAPMANGVLLLRDPAQGKLLIEMEGRLLASASSLNEEQRAKLEKTCRDWANWLGIRLADAPVIPAAPSEPVPVHPAPPPPQPAGFRATLSKGTAPLRMPPAVEPIPATIFPSTKPNLEGARPAPTMVMQIDEILQDMAAKSPLGIRAVRITEEPRLGVIVWVGTTRYQGIDSVTDPDVRSLIRAAVAEWERRAEPGV